MSIITLSREIGSLGSEIADTLASRLGWSRLDKESLEDLLKKLGMADPKFDGEDEKRPGFWEQFTVEKNRYFTFMKAAMYRFAAEKDCIIVGRGANIIFRGIPGTLRLRIIAPHAVRAARLSERLDIDEEHALHLVHQSDHDRSGYHRYFFNAAWDSPADYDVVVNTAAISPAEACDMVSALLRSSASAADADLSREVLTDSRIAQDAAIAILYRERIPVTSLDVVCRKGVVDLHGVVRFPAAMDWCLEAAGKVEGAQRVISHLDVVELAYYAGV
jgi:cytidylate kinase